MGTAAQSTQPQSTQPIQIDDAYDLDSHEMVPLEFWSKVFGNKDLVELLEPLRRHPQMTSIERNSISMPHLVADDAEINYDSVWWAKGAAAPSGIDINRRLDVLNAQGIDRALIFATGFGFIGARMHAAPDIAEARIGLKYSHEELRELGRRLVRAYNDWVIDTQRNLGTRVRPVALLLTESIDQMMRDLADLIDRGLRAVWIPNSQPPAGTSPADPALDPFWRMAADANVAVTQHVGQEFAFLASEDWVRNVPCLGVRPGLEQEFAGGGLSFATLTYPAETYLTALVWGGVFERVPNLRFGVIEQGGRFLGPLAERLDEWWDQQSKSRRGKELIPEMPSVYLNRNVRVTPFPFEPIDLYFDRYPQLQDCFCFSTDYPHVEGGNDTKARQMALLQRHGPEIIQKYFKNNGALLLP